MTVVRARKLRKRFTRIAFAVLVVATVANVTGFDVFFMPLAVVSSLCLMRASHWDGWLSGHAVDGKIVAAALTVDTAWRTERGSFDVPMRHLAKAVDEAYPDVLAAQKP